MEASIPGGARSLNGRRVLAALILSGSAAAAHAQHASIWGGAGLGSFLSGGPSEPNYNRFLAVAASWPGDALRLRYFKGTFERSRELPPNAGDDDFDYYGFDAVVTRRATGLPIDLAGGVARFEEVYPVGYPHFDLGGRAYIHRWGPHLAALRSWPAGRYGELWAETDLHLAPYQPHQWVAFLDVGLGAHL